MDLLQQYESAILARPIVEQLPAGLKEHAQQYEQMLINDLNARLGSDQASVIIKEVERSVLQNFIIPFLKQHAPTATITGTVLALIQYVAQYLQK